MHHHESRWVLALFSLALAVPTLTAMPGLPTFRSEADLVRLNVVVLDPQGRPVTGLSAKDFSVLEEGQPQELELFARASEPGQDEALTLDLGMLFDTSESMLKELRLSQEAAARFLEAIPRARDLLTVFFDQDIRISRYDSENQQGLFERIWKAKGGGNTALYDAIAVYLSRVDDRPGRKVLVLFSDGEDSTSTLTINDVRELLKASPVTIYAIGFRGAFSTGSSRQVSANAVMYQLAHMTGGALYNPSSSADLDDIYAKILGDLNSQYVLGYAPSNAKRDGRFRKLKVLVKDKRLRVRCREGYMGLPPLPASAAGR